MQDTRCKTQGSKFCWADFAFFSFWGRPHPTNNVDHFWWSLSFMDGSRAIWALFQQLQDFWEEPSWQGEGMVRQRQWRALCSGGATLLLVTLLSQGGAATVWSGALHVFTFFMPDFLLCMNDFSVVWPTERNQRSLFSPRAGCLLTLVLLLQIPVWFIWQAGLLHVPRT